MGFTLIELMIVVAIIAILATIALPSYNSYVKKAHIKAAQSDLVALGTSIEGIYQRQLEYPTKCDLSGTNKTCTNGTTAASIKWTPSENIFDYSYTYNASDAYSLKAVGKSNSNLKGCSIELTSANSKKITDCGSFNNADAW
ncbi:type IV pilin protein [Acinetobacter puyangensis]